ncbi:spore protease YyaC [Clostridium sp. BJN0001]|uniref:spore protease YyaC n=1 Tax=Clostridium sp. BJN0001 TaxID=2930219 RepID=UPI001FD4DEEE|nr:spore protease YyaC [Clostridium sp. BJN0001]
MNNEYMLSKQLMRYLDKDTAIICIGTNKCIGDSLGPIVGTLLTLNCFPLQVYGNLNHQIHALNIDRELSEIYKKFSNSKLIGIDACLGYEKDIGTIKIRNCALNPGRGVGKTLPKIGTSSIIGIVDSSNNSDSFFNKNISKSFIMNMAKSISRIIFNAYDMYNDSFHD